MIKEYIKEQTKKWTPFAKNETVREMLAYLAFVNDAWDKYGKKVNIQRTLKELKNVFETDDSDYLYNYLNKGNNNEQTKH